MATGAVDRLHKPNATGFRSIFLRRKRAHKSKGLQGITVKKRFPEDSNGFQDFKDLGGTHLQDKRKFDATEVTPFKKSRVLNEAVQNCNGGGVCKTRDAIPGCGSVDDCQSLNDYKSGSFGTVYRVRDKKTGEIMAMKDLMDGLSVMAMREIDVLKRLRGHLSIVEFKRVVADECDGVYIVMEYLENDLRNYVKDMERPFSLSEVKYLMKQLLEGVKHIHEKGVMHRDLKPANILIRQKGELELKICDFGLSCWSASEAGMNSPNVGTLWYRAPELLLGAKMYSNAIDMWSVGCIMAELLLGKAIFKARSEIGQVGEIFRILGTPDETVWPGFSSLPGSRANFERQPFNRLGEKLAPVLSELGLDLVSQFLTYDPNKRITAKAALSHGWFREIPLPSL